MKFEKATLDIVILNVSDIIITSIICDGNLPSPCSFN